jgi:hypothetical protein
LELLKNLKASSKLAHSVYLDDGFCVKVEKKFVVPKPRQSLMPGVGCGGTPILDVWEHARTI